MIISRCGKKNTNEKKCNDVNHPNTNYNTSKVIQLHTNAVYWTKTDSLSQTDVAAHIQCLDILYTILLEKKKQTPKKKKTQIIRQYLRKTFIISTSKTRKNKTDLHWDRCPGGQTVQM